MISRPQLIACVRDISDSMYALATKTNEALMRSAPAKNAAPQSHATSRREEQWAELRVLSVNALLLAIQFRIWLAKYIGAVSQLEAGRRDLMEALCVFTQPLFAKFEEYQTAMETSTRAAFLEAEGLVGHTLVNDYFDTEDFGALVSAMCTILVESEELDCDRLTSEQTTTVLCSLAPEPRLSAVAVRAYRRAAAWNVLPTLVLATEFGEANPYHHMSPWELELRLNDERSLSEVRSERPAPRPCRAALRAESRRALARLGIGPYYRHPRNIPRRF